MAEDLFSSHTPFTPPTTEEDRLFWLRLIRSRRVGARTFYRLMHAHGSAEAALHALPAVAAEAGVTDYTPCPHDVARAEYDAAMRAGARMLCFGMPEYPATLAAIGDAPPLLWALGDAALLSRPMVALVGARNASSLGLRMARKLAEGLGAHGHVVVSGLARGIDAAAHGAALGSGTIAVHAGGVDIRYPPENAALADAVAAQGLRLSERPPGHEPQARCFPRRNRIISGLCSGVVVIEAAARSGSLITARDALEQGREVLAVPGHPFDARSEGCNTLLREGATLVRGVDDIIAALPPADAADCTEPAARARHAPDDRPDARRGGPAQPPPGRTDRPAARPPSAPRHATLGANDIDAAAAPQHGAAQTRALHDTILARLGPSPLPEDQLIRDLDLPPARVAPELTTLELDGRIARHAGGLLSRVS